MKHHKLPQIFTNHHETSQTIMKHHESLWTTTKHHEPPHVLTKTARFGQYLSEFLTDLQETFTK